LKSGGWDGGGSGLSACALQELGNGTNLHHKERGVTERVYDRSKRLVRML